MVRSSGLFTAVAALIGLFTANLLFASPFVRSWDEVDFVLSLDRYDLLAMQPHFPGYPYFIAGASIVHQWVSDPVTSLIVFNAVLALSSAIPIALLAKRYVGASLAAWASVWVLVTPYLWLMSSRPMSECAGIAMLWWFLWSVREAAEQPRSIGRHIVTMLLFSLLMGIRLSFFPFGIALVLLWVDQYRSLAGEKFRHIRLVLSLMLAAGTQLVWIVGLIMSEGTISGFWKLANAFIAGHFSEWGGGIASVNMPLGARMVTLFADNLIVDVMLSQSVMTGVLYVLLLLLIGVGLWLLRANLALGVASSRFNLWLSICIIAYVLWALLGQNIEKPRHIAPIAGPLILAMYILAVHSIRSLCRSRDDHRRRVAYSALGYGIALTMLGIAMVQVIHGAKLLKVQAEEKPAIYQMHEYIESLDQPLIVYTWEETRVLQYVQAEYEHRRILTFDYMHALAHAAPNQRVLLTDHVLSGFLLQDADASSYVTPLKQFSSESLLDPVYSRITLYEWHEPD